jgi:hypothetical protein
MQHQDQHTCDSTDIMASTQQYQRTKQEQQQHEAQLATNQQVPEALAGLIQQPCRIVNQGQQQCNTEPDWLDEGISLIGFQAPASAAGAPSQVAAAAPHTALEAGLSSISPDSATAVSGGVGAACGLSEPTATTAADLLTALTAHARGEGSVSTSGSTSSDTSTSDSSGTHAAAVVGVRVSALLELQQLMLVLADAAATAQRSQKPPAPCTQQQGSNGSSDRTGSSSKGNTAHGTTCSTGISVVLGPSWLQSVLGAAMDALSHADPSLRR